MADFSLHIKPGGGYFYSFDGGEKSELQMSGTSLLLLLSLRTKAKQTQMRFSTCIHQRGLEPALHSSVILCLQILPFPLEKWIVTYRRVRHAEDLFRYNYKTLWDPEMRSVLKLNLKFSEAQKDIFNLWDNGASPYILQNYYWTLQSKWLWQRISQAAHSTMKPELIILSCAFALYYFKDIFLLSSSKL